MTQLGTPPMPWQREHLDVAYELDEDATEAASSAAGRFSPRLAYRECRVTIQRQAGKTTAALGRHVDRHLNSGERGWCRPGIGPVTLYTAQSASAARDKLIEEWAPMLEASALAPHVKQVLRSNGRESVIWNSPGGRLLTVPPTRTGGHGITGVDLVDVDEAFSHRDATVEQGVRPTMITRPAPQIWVVSTAGTLESEYLWGKVDDGRARVEAGIAGPICYFEWSAPADAGPEEMADCHPAVGYTITRDALLAEIDAMASVPGGIDGARRAYGNIWTASVQRLIPANAWAACLDPDAAPVGRLVLSADAAPGAASGQLAAIAAGGRTAAGIPVAEVIDAAPGLAWVAPRINELAQRHGAEALVIDPASPINAILPDIEQQPYCPPIQLMEARTVTAACGRFLEDVMTGEFSHRGQPALDNAVDGAARRVLLDAWAFTRRRSTTDISPLVAVVNAHWGVVSQPQDFGRVY
jgi:hypothetical protein